MGKEIKKNESWVKKLIINIVLKHVSGRKRL